MGKNRETVPRSMPPGSAVEGGGLGLGGGEDGPGWGAPPCGVGAADGSMVEEKLLGKLHHLGHPGRVGQEGIELVLQLRHGDPSPYRCS